MKFSRPWKTPRPVAEVRPWMPPWLTGFPVTQAWALMSSWPCKGRGIISDVMGSLCFYYFFFKLYLHLLKSNFSQLSNNINYKIFFFFIYIYTFKIKLSTTVQLITSTITHTICISKKFQNIKATKLLMHYIITICLILHITPFLQ